MNIIKTTLIALILASAVTAHAAPPKGYRLYFPDLILNKTDGERIDEINIKVACGHIEAITGIPDDWNIEVIRAISAVEEFHASAGHGASRLDNIKILNGVIHITVGEKDCFDVSASIMTLGMEAGRQIELPKSKLKLRK